MEEPTALEQEGWEAGRRGTGLASGSGCKSWEKRSAPCAQVERTVIQSLGLIYGWEAADIHWAWVTLSSLPTVTAPQSP